MRKTCVWVSLCWLILVCACSHSSDSLSASLEELVSADLKKIIQDLKTRGIDSLAGEEPCYAIIDYQEFSGDSARVYLAYAEVHFYYLKSLKLYQVRKYRFNTAMRVWDRYEVKLKHLYKPPPSGRQEGSVCPGDRAE